MKRHFLIGLIALLASLTAIPVPAQSAQTVTLTLNWQATVKNSDGSTATGVTYKVLQGAQGAETVSQTGITGTTATVSNVPVGTQICFEVDSIDGDGISTPSNETCTTPAIVTPVAPTLLTITCPVPTSSGPVNCTATASTPAAMKAKRLGLHVTQH